LASFTTFCAFATTPQQNKIKAISKDFIFWFSYGTAECVKGYRLPKKTSLILHS
jgi:hypothetical protein